MASNRGQACFLICLGGVLNFAHVRGNGDGFRFAVFVVIGVFFVPWHLGKYLANSSDADERIFAGVFESLALFY
jgi:hypothetical protein